MSGDGGFVISKHKQFNGEDVQALFKTLLTMDSQTRIISPQRKAGNYRISGLAAAAFASNLPTQID